MADPNASIAQGIANLTKMFAPPDGQQMYAYAHAKALADEERRKAAGLSAVEQIYGPEAAAIFRAGGAAGFANYPKADLYRRSQQPGADPRALDAGVYATHGDAGNTFQGLGIKEGGLNARNAADIKGRMDVALVAPVGMNATRNLPPEIAQRYGMPQVYSGMREYDQGKAYDVPVTGAAPGTAQRVMGPVKPLTMDEWTANQAMNMPAVDQRRLLMRGVPTDDVIDPLTNKPRVMYRDDAAAGGVQPYDKAKGIAYQSRSVMLPDGRSVVGRFNPQDGSTTLVDGSPLPAGAVVTTTPSIQAASPDAMRPGVQTDAQKKLMDLDHTDAIAGKLADLVKQNAGSQGAPGALRGIVQNLAATSGDVAKLFGTDIAQQVISSADPAVFGQLGLGPDGRTFDPAIPKIQLYEHMLAGLLAKSLDPNGRVSVDGMKRAREMIGAGGVFANSQQTLAYIEAIKEANAAQRAVAQGYAGRGQPPAPMAPAGTLNPPQPGIAPAPAGALPVPPPQPVVPPLPPGFRPVQ